MRVVSGQTWSGWQFFENSLTSAFVYAQRHALGTLASEGLSPMSQEAKVGAHVALTRVANLWLQGRVVDVDSEGLNLGVVEQVVPVLSCHLVAALDFLQIPVGPEKTIFEHGQRERMLYYSHLQINLNFVKNGRLDVKKLSKYGV